MKSYNEKSDEGHFLQTDVQYLRKLHELHNDLPISPEILKIGKVEKLVAKLHTSLYLSLYMYFLFTCFFAPVLFCFSKIFDTLFLSD